MGRLYKRLKCWYYLKFHHVILGEIAQVHTFSVRTHKPGELTSKLKGSEQSLIEAYKTPKPKGDNKET